MPQQTTKLSQRAMWHIRNELVYCGRRLKKACNFEKLMPREAHITIKATKTFWHSLTPA